MNAGPLSAPIVGCDATDSGEVVGHQSAIAPNNPGLPEPMGASLPPPERGVSDFCVVIYEFLGPPRASTRVLLKIPGGFGYLYCRNF